MFYGLVPHQLGAVSGSLKVRIPVALKVSRGTYEVKDLVLLVFCVPTCALICTSLGRVSRLTYITGTLCRLVILRLLAKFPFCGEVICLHIRCAVVRQGMT